MQFHLGDVGMISGNMWWGVVFAVWRATHKEIERLAQVRDAPGATVQSLIRLLCTMAAPRIPLAIFAMSLVIYMVSLGTELLTAFAQHVLFEQEGTVRYSGKFDWVDAAAYTIGMAAMALNYVLIGRKISRHLAAQQAK